MVVEWGRSCYQSEWHLFRDDSSATTAGRYYFAEPGTQHFPGSHNVGSRNWHDKNWGAAQRLGEDLESPQVWNPGTPPAQVPNAIILGSLDCIRNGEKLPGIKYEDLNDGIPIDCYGPGEKNPLWFEVSSYARCTLQRYYMALVNWLYDDEVDLITNSITDWLGPTVQVRVHPSEGLLCAVITIVHPQFSVAIMDGTRDFQTLALEAFQQFRRPTDFGLFGTLPLWYDASSRVNAFLEADGAIAAAPVMLAGHSYGGAVAANVAARYRHANFDRVVRYMTWGMPKPGDARMIELLDRCEGINLVNDDDPVPSLPPDELTLLPVETDLGLPGLNVYLDWKRPTMQALLLQSGKLTMDEKPLVGYATLLNMVSRALANQDQFIIVGHRSPEYFRRTSLRCPRKEWPIDEKVWEAMQQPLPEFLLHAPIVPNTRLIFGGSPGGTSCTDAITLSFGDVVTLTSPTLKRWYKIAVADGETIHVNASCTSNFLAHAYLGPDCDHLVFQGNVSAINDSECFEFTSVSDKFLWLNVAGLSAGFPATFGPDNGPC